MYKGATPLVRPWGNGEGLGAFPSQPAPLVRTKSYVFFCAQCAQKKARGEGCGLEMESSRVMLRSEELSRGGRDEVVVRGALGAQ